MSSQRFESIRAYQSARSLAVVCLVLAVGSNIGWYLATKMSLIEWHTASVVTAALTVLISRSKNKSQNFYALVSAINLMMIIGASAYTNFEMINRQTPFVPLAGYKVVAFIVAAIPIRPFKFTYTFLGLVVLMCLGQYWYLAHHLDLVFPSQEPWMSIVSFAVALAFLYFRISGLELEARLVKAVHETNYLKKLATTFVAIKDLSNTPLQSIETTRYLLAQEKIDPKDAAESLKAALGELGKLMNMLDRRNDDVDWNQVTPSFDASAILKDSMQPPPHVDH